MTCPCVEELTRVGLRLGRGRVSFVTVRHDPWCTVTGGDGGRDCVPGYELDGEDISEFVRNVPPEGSE